MRFVSPVLAAVLVAASTVAALPSDTSPLKLNGWYPCSRSKATVLPSAPAFECAEVEVPLCHTNVCTSTKTIDLFVKRLVADAAPPATTTSASNRTSTKRPAMWILQGGPGYSSQASASAAVFMTRYHTSD